MAFAITGDAFISTISKFHNKDLNYWNWAGFLALTHSAFPAVSFVAFASLASISSAASVAVSLFGVLLILLVVYEMLCDAFAATPIFSLSHWIENVTGLHKQKAKHFMLVLAVSWDALTLGPLLVLEARLQQWDNYMVVGIFIIFAIIVGTSLVATLSLSAKLRENHFSDTGKLAQLNFYGSFLEISVIASFAITLILEVCLDNSNMLVSLAISTSIFSVVFTANRSVLWQNAQTEASETVAE